MIVQLKQWGNSQGIRLTKEMLEKAGIQIGETLEVTAMEGKIVIEKAFVHRSLEERAAAFGGELCLDGEWNTEEGVGREIW